MSLSGNMMSEVPDSATLSRAFGELFSGAKETFDGLQKELAGVLPSMPGMPVGKFGDLSVGIDMHPTVTPPSPVMAVPHVGKVYDIMAEIMAGLAAAMPEQTGGIGAVAAAMAKGMAPSVKVHGKWIAQAGVGVLLLPAYVIHPAPMVSGTAEAEMYMGSSTVLADGAPCSTLTHPTLSCNIAGIPSIPRANKPKKAAKALLAPTAILTTATSAGKPVMVGGPPTIDLFAAGMKLGLKGLGKMGKKFRNFTRKFTHAVHAYIESLGLNPKLTKILKKTACTVLGEPVDVATGRVYHTNTDFELPGPIPVVWERTYYSDAAVDGPLGYNWHHSYNLGIHPLGDEAFLFRHADGRESALPALGEGESHFDREEQLTWTRDAEGYLLEDADGTMYRFNGPENRQGYRMVSSVSTRDGFAVRFTYGAAGSLKEIATSRDETLRVDTDDKGRVTAVTLVTDAEETLLVGYRYDGHGDMVQTTDARGVSKHFEYGKGHLLTRLTNQGGMAFHWEYEGEGENARCVHTWGDGGVMEYFFEYAQGVTRTRNGEGAVSEYHYDSDRLIYKVVDANGGITRKQYNAYKELKVTVDPEGNCRKTEYNRYGLPSVITDANGNTTLLTYDGDRNLTRMKTSGGRVLAWDYDTMGRLTARTGPDGQKTRYGYEGKLLRTITDGQGRTYRLTFDDRYNLTMMEYPNGLFRRWSYDRRGRLAEEVDVKGNATRYGYDEADNLIRLEEPDGNTHRFEYDAMGNMVHAQDGIREVRFTYGALGVLKSREQERHRITFGYNSELQLKRIGNEAGEDYRFELDGLGQVTAETGFDGIRREYERDGAGNVVRVARPGGKWTRYEYDGEGNILRELQYDGEESLYTYDKDGLLVKAGNGECLTELVRDRKTGRVTEERQGGHSVRSEYDGEGNRTRVTSTLGADIRHAYDRDGYLQSMQAGEGWNASWMRDSAGLEMQRTCSGGITVRTERDRFGRETRKSVRSGSIERGAWRYEWGMADRLLSKENELTGTVMRYDYDRFDFLIRQETTKGSATDVIYRVPDFVGNLYGTPERKDRRYGAGGRLLEDAECIYHYDDEGNLVFREFRQPREDAVRHDRRRMEREYGIRHPVTDMGWLYEWTSGGMLRRVVRPDGRPVEFRYDALGRRTAKQYLGKVTHWVWDGNTPLHEWVSAATDNEGQEKAFCPDRNSLTTWIFEEGTFVPAAKIQGDRQCSIVSDYLGTPVQMYDSEGNKTWDCTLDIYGKVLAVDKGTEFDCPFRFQGQYEDAEIGLYYNRFRYYDPNLGGYISQDPISFFGGNLALYTYINNPNIQFDALGLHTMEGEIYSQKGGDLIFQKEYISGHTNKGKLNFQEQLSTHTERYFLKNAKYIVASGNHLKMVGALNPCRPGCQPAIRRFVLENNVTAEYFATDTNTKFEWYKSADGKVIQVENGIKYEYKYDENLKQKGRRKKINH